MRFGTPTYCYLRGPHYHWYAPPPQAQFELRGGAYWYVGTYDPVYYSERPRFAVINTDAYAPVVYARPVIDIRVAPPAFHGEIVGGAPGGGGAVVGAPVVQAGVHIAAPPPPVVQLGVGVGIGGPPAGVRYHDNGKHNGWNKHGRGGWRGPPPAARGRRLAWPAPGPGARCGGWRGRPAARAVAWRWRLALAVDPGTGAPEEGRRRRLEALAMSISRAARFVVVGAAVAMSTSLGLSMSGCKKQAADGGGAPVAPGATAATGRRPAR